VHYQKILISWSSINDAGSGGYKFAKSLDADVTPSLAQATVTEALQVIRGIYGRKVSVCLLGNILCELNREQNGEKGQSSKHDCLFKFTHRDGRMQNCYRLKFSGTTSSAIIEILPWKVNDSGKRKSSRNQVKDRISVFTECNTDEICNNSQVFCVQLFRPIHFI